MAFSLQNLYSVLPGILVVTMVVISSLIFTYIDNLDVPEEDDKYKNARIYSIVNLTISSLLFIVVAVAYLRTMKMQRNYITYF